MSISIRSFICMSILIFAVTLFTGCRGSTPCREITPDAYLNVHQPLGIMTCGMAGVEEMVKFFAETNPNGNIAEVMEIAQYYIDEAALENVNHDIAFCQMCVETNYLRFTGVVSRSQNNFAGIGATGGDNPGNSFTTMQEGVRAQIQHLKAYASRERLRSKNVDPRFEKVKRGSASFVVQLAGKWAADPQYGIKIRAKLKDLGRHIQSAQPLY